MANSVIIPPEPEPSGYYCANKLYQWELDCPNAATVEWYVRADELPDGVVPDDVYANMTGRLSLAPCVTFPVSGAYCLRAKCCTKRACHPLIDESTGKAIEILCFGQHICGIAHGFFPGDIVNIDPFGLSSAITENGNFCIVVAGAVDGTEFDITVNGVNHNGCSVSATTSGIIDNSFLCTANQPQPCWEFGLQVTYIAGSQICGVVQGYTFGDTVSILINTIQYSATVFPDPNTGLPIWCIDVDPVDYAGSVGDALVATITDGTCSSAFPFVFV